MQKQYSWQSATALILVLLMQTTQGHGTPQEDADALLVTEDWAGATTAFERLLAVEGENASNGNDLRMRWWIDPRTIDR